MIASSHIAQDNVNSLKHQLVAAVARGDQFAAEEIRMLLRLNAPEMLRGMRRD